MASFIILGEGLGDVDAYEDQAGTQRSSRPRSLPVRRNSESSDGIGRRFSTNIYYPYRKHDFLQLEIIYALKTGLRSGLRR